MGNGKGRERYERSDCVVDEGSVEEVGFDRVGWHFDMA
jgi:hypothetical protein